MCAKYILIINKMLEMCVVTALVEANKIKTLYLKIKSWPGGDCGSQISPVNTRANKMDIPVGLYGFIFLIQK